MTTNKLISCLLLIIVIILSLILGNYPFLISNHKTSMVKLEGMTPQSAKKPPSPSIKK
jgi:hypothetical protein